MPQLVNLWKAEKPEITCSDGCFGLLHKAAPCRNHLVEHHPDTTDVTALYMSPEQARGIVLTIHEIWQAISRPKHCELEVPRQDPRPIAMAFLAAASAFGSSKENLGKR